MRFTERKIRSDVASHERCEELDGSCFSDRIVLDDHSRLVRPCSEEQKQEKRNVNSGPQSSYRPQLVGYDGCT